MVKLPPCKNALNWTLDVLATSVNGRNCVLKKIS